MSYIRLYMRQPFAHEKNIELKTLFLTKISNLDFEEICLERYQYIIQYMIEKAEFHSTLAEDMTILK